MKKTTAQTDAPLDIEVSYEDEETRLSYEIAAQVRYLDATLPPEPTELASDYKLTPITFATDNLEKGEIALFFIGDFLHVSDDETIHYIRPRTRRILDVLGVQYDEVISRGDEIRS